MKLGDIAARVGVMLDGDPDLDIVGVATLKSATVGHIAFLANGKYRRELSDCGASAVILHPAERAQFRGAALIDSHPYAAYARIAALFAPADRDLLAAPVHPSALIEPDAEVDPSAQIGAFALIARGARIAADCVVGPYCHVARGVTLGAGCVLIARVTLLDGVTLGARVRVHPGAVIGSDGFGLAPDAGRWRKVPQLGSVRIGDDCEIGANTTIDRGALDDTVLGDDVRLDNQVQIAHNVRIGAHTAMAGCSAVAGSATIGAHCLIGGGAGVLGHLTLCDHVTITAMSLVTHDIREPGEYSSGTPLDRNLNWRKNAVRFTHLDQLARTVKQLTRDTP
jgi:UDP-3-O-[3-hydroxymyristoyl] glucosamine N-acyltransferase